MGEEQHLEDAVPWVCLGDQVARRHTDPHRVALPPAADGVAYAGQRGHLGDARERAQIVESQPPGGAQRRQPRRPAPLGVQGMRCRRLARPAGGCRAPSGRRAPAQRRTAPTSRPVQDRRQPGERRRQPAVARRQHGHNAADIATHSSATVITRNLVARRVLPELATRLRAARLSTRTSPASSTTLAGRGGACSSR